MGDYRVEPLTPDIFDELGPLMLDAFDDRVGADYFDWKYRQNPAGAAIGNIARDPSGEIAAFYGMIPEVIEYRGEQRQIYQSCDTMTHSRHRRRGLFQLLAEKTYADGTARDPGFFAYGFGGPTSTPGLLKMGWRIEQELPFLFQPFPLTLLCAGHSAVPVSNSDPELLAMIRQAQPEDRVSVRRDEQFLRWRLASPLREYRSLKSDGAYAVYAVFPGFLFITDYWEEAPSRGRPVVRALRRASLKLRNKGLLTMVSRNGRCARMLRKHGFLRNALGRGPGGDSRPLAFYGRNPFESAEAEWESTPLDHDSY